jgi:hypothetical protein
MHSWKLPRYITYDLRWCLKHYKVSVLLDGRVQYIGNYRTLTEAIQARDEYCTVHGIQIREKDQWQYNEDNLSM